MRARRDVSAVEEIGGERVVAALEGDGAVEIERLELSAKGVEFLGAPKVEPWGTFAIMRDPDGNQFVLSSK